MSDIPQLDLSTGNAAESEEKLSGEAEFEETMIVVYGLWGGDLTRLADYLRAGYPLHDILRREVLAALDGTLAGGFYKPLKLQAKGRVGRRTPFTETASWNRNSQICDYFEAQLPKFDGDTEAAISSTADTFGVKRTTVTDARKAVRQWTKELKEEFERRNPLK